ncbi:choline/glycine/proline betaine transport protein [Arthrobacter sp. AG1021]|nr:choline/glycine/proline betaine transport protein [Arthrobacter sp. AG1021]
MFEVMTTANSESDSSDADTAQNPGTPRTRINKVVFFGSASLVLGIALWAIFDRDSADLAISTAVDWIGRNFGWYYTLIIVAALLFVIAAAVSKVGKTRLGPDHARPAFNMFTWAAMLFAAGIGIDLMFFSVSEPITQYLAPPTGEGSTVEAARQAMVWTLFHYGLLGWGLYALIGMALGYFSYRRNLPLSIRSALYPILGKRTSGWMGHTVDIAAMLGTIFGIATSLGIGVAQLNYGLHFMFGIPENRGWQIILIVIAVVMATISVLTGVEKGIRRLSELNVLLCVALMLFILVTGGTAYLMDGIITNVGDSIARFPSMALDTFAYDRPESWLNGWTLFFWAWWIAWAPFVGLFLARISRGRTIRQFVTGVLVVPFAFILLWISIFGNSALQLVRSGNEAFGEVAMNTPERAFYSLLEQFPAAPFTAAVATFTGLLFYVTSADSGALVMANFTSHLKDPQADGSKPVRLFWSLATGLLTLGMLFVDGVPTLQGATVIMGLPFSFVLLLIMLGLFKSLRIESALASSYKNTMHEALTSRLGSVNDRRSWKQRLARSMTYPGLKAARRYLDEVARTALDEVAEEFRSRGADVEVTLEPVPNLQLPSLDLLVATGAERPFKYQVYPVQLPVPRYARSAPGNDVYYRIEVFSQEGSHGYDLMGLSKEQVIGDILDQYEAHLGYLDGQLQADEPSQVNVEAVMTTRWESDFEHTVREES